MKSRNAAISAVIALTMATGQLAFAQDRGNRNERGGDQQRQPQRQSANADRHDQRGFGRAHEEESRHGRGVGPNHEYYRGDRLPASSRHNNYVVNDWRSHHLSAPPRGHRWVQSGNDYILVAITTGIIAGLVLGH